MKNKNRKSKSGHKLNKIITKEAKFFLIPDNVKHRQYEAFRAFFVENLPVNEVARMFGYTPGSFKVMCHNFRNGSITEDDFFQSGKKGPKYGPKKDKARSQIIALRKQNLSAQDIQVRLKDEGISMSTVYIWKILDEEGFQRLPRRPDEDRPDAVRPDREEYADIRQLSLAANQVIETKIAGIFILFGILSEMKIHNIPKSLKWYGTKMIPVQNAFLSSLFLKLVGKRRKSHIMDICFDKGAGLSVGLNVLPKRSYIAEYSERITHEDNLKFLERWVKTLRSKGILNGESINLDFQSLPYFGDDDIIEKHYVSMRSRRQSAVLVFFAQDAESKIFCYSNSDIRKGEEKEEIFKFIDFWKKQTGKIPPHLVFDSTLTTYSSLSRINDMGILFVTLRRRSQSILKEVMNLPSSAWRKIDLGKVDRKYRFPKVFDQKTTIQGYKGKIRQIFVKDLGHDLPTVIITNDEKTSVTNLVLRYALRMLIENSIANGVKFFHTTSLSSSVAIRIDFDILLTLIGQATYHILAQKLRGYERCGADTIFRKFIDTPGKILIGKKEIEVRLNKRANNPILLKSGLLNSPFSLPWIKGKKIIITLR